MRVFPIVHFDVNVKLEVKMNMNVKVKVNGETEMTADVVCGHFCWSVGDCVCPLYCILVDLFVRAEYRRLLPGYSYTAVYILHGVFYIIIITSSAISTDEYCHKCEDECGWKIEGSH